MYSFVIVLGVWALCFLPKLCSHDLWTVVSLLTQDVLAPCKFQIMPVVRVITREYIRWQKSSYVGLVHTTSKLSVGLGPSAYKGALLPSQRDPAR